MLGKNCQIKRILSSIKSKTIQMESTTHILNPRTGRLIKINGAVYKKLVLENVINPINPINTNSKNNSVVITQSQINLDDMCDDEIYSLCKIAANHCIIGSTKMSYESYINQSPFKLLKDAITKLIEMEKNIDFAHIGIHLKIVDQNIVAFDPKTRFETIIRKVDGKSIAEIATKKKEPIQCMNEAMFSTLDTLDDWSELQSWRQFISHDGYVFDILFLVKLFTDQLNTEKSFNPFPIFPNNPFTREPFVADDFIKMKLILESNQIQPSHVLHMFLQTSYLWNHELDINNWRNLCIEAFESQLRFVRQFNNIESNRELKLLCYWTVWNAPKAPTELSINKYLRTMNHGILTRLYHGPRYTFLPYSYYFKDKNQVTEPFCIVDRLPI